MIGIDTGYLLAVCQARDSLHQRALAWAAALFEPMLVTEYILLETFNALSHPIDRPKAHALLHFLRTNANYAVVPADSALFDKGLILHKNRADKEWSLTDCISFLVFADHNIGRVLAYDHHFEQAGFEALLKRDPP